MADVFLFWFLAFVTLGSGLIVLFMANPVYSALALAMTMVGVSALFVTLEAYFLAGVQLIVYAGAVMVLFVMVLMLFDLKHELQAFTRGKATGILKILTVGVLAGLVVGAVTLTQVKSPALSSSDVAVTSTEGGSPQSAGVSKSTDNTKELSQNLFLKNVFGFEALGILLLVIAVGTVALSRSRGGTHARD